MSGFITKIFDDTHTALVYGGTWIHGTWNASHTGETGTLSTSNGLVGTNVTFVSSIPQCTFCGIRRDSLHYTLKVFPEAAIAFYYYAIRRSQGAKYGMCIDCDVNNPKFETIDALNRTDDGKNPPVSLPAQLDFTLETKFDHFDKGITLLKALLNPRLSSSNPPQ